MCYFCQIGTNRRRANACDLHQSCQSIADQINRGLMLSLLLRLAAMPRNPLCRGLPQNMRLSKFALRPLAAALFAIQVEAASHVAGARSHCCAAASVRLGCSAACAATGKNAEAVSQNRSGDCFHRARLCVAASFLFHSIHEFTCMGTSAAALRTLNTGDELSIDVHNYHATHC